MVAHGSILSIFNFNAAKCNKQEWQHYPFESTLDDFFTEEQQFFNQTTKDQEFCPFGIC
jgi:hypothetical protein